MALRQEEREGVLPGEDAWRVKPFSYCFSPFIHPAPLPAPTALPPAFSKCCLLCPCLLQLLQSVPLPQQDTNPASLQRPNKTGTYKYVTVFLSSWHKSKKKKKRKKKILLAQGSRVFIFLPAATCYPHRGSPKTSYGLGWRGMSSLSCRLGLSQ